MTNLKPTETVLTGQWILQGGRSVAELRHLTTDEARQKYGSQLVKT